MKNQFHNSPESLRRGQDKDRDFKAQMVKVWKEWQKQPATMKMVSVALGIDRANICWFVPELEEKGLIKRIGKGICPITKASSVWYFTADPDLFGITDLFGNNPKPQGHE